MILSSTSSALNIISAPGFSPTTIGFENILAQSITVGNTIKVYQNNGLLNIPRYTVTSSDTGIASGFTTSRTSTYSTTIYAGAKLNDVVTFTLRNYNYSATYKVEELLQNPAIVLR